MTAAHKFSVSRHVLWLCLALVAIVPCDDASQAGPAAAEAPADVHFYFVQITDTHFGTPDTAKRTAKAVEMINALPMKIKCVLHTGDITSNKLEHEPTVAASLAAFKRIKAPLHILPGNHDIVVRNRIATLAIYKRKYGKLLIEAHYDGVAFIGVYTEPLAADFPLESFDPLKRLAAALKRAGSRPAIVFHHTPSVDDFYRNRMHAGWDSTLRAKWTKLLNAHNVKAVIAGHFHRDEHHWLGRVPLYVSSSIAGMWGRQASFRIYEYRNGKLSYRTQYIE
ncbi:MAG: metallophosphoesterase [Phycisphaerae bacterium]|nr:metallophosphoesterase [Phycisphaerae bacterium]